MKLKFLVSIMAIFMTCSLSSHARAEMSVGAQKLKLLYEELEQFKDDPEFHQVGFGACCRFNEWLKKIQELSKINDLSTMVEVGFLPGDLLQLGNEYLGSHGKPTEYTKSMEPIFREGLSIR